MWGSQEWKEVNIEIMEPKLLKSNVKFWKTLCQELISAHFTVFANGV
jgi:hypothetical protein